MKLTKSALREIIREELSAIEETENLNEAAKSLFTIKGKRKNNNIVAAIYFGWVKQDNNNSSFWNKVINIIEGEDCVVLNYLATDSVCEFEFKPSSPSGQDELEDASNRIEDAIGALSGFTKYDVYIVGN